MKRFVLTGAPGSGKSTILEQLNEMGYKTFEERARIRIAEALQNNSELVPWKNHLGFSKLVFNDQIAQFNSQTDEIAFYDRGFIDVLGYLSADNIAPPHHMIQKAIKHQYNTQVFYFAPWEAIHRHDELRRESLEDVTRIVNAIKKSYHNYGYQLIEVPKVSLEKRIEFILQTLDL